MIRPRLCLPALLWLSSSLLHAQGDYADCPRSPVTALAQCVLSKGTFSRALGEDSQTPNILRYGEMNSFGPGVDLPCFFTVKGGPPPYVAESRISFRLLILQEVVSAKYSKHGTYGQNIQNIGLTGTARVRLPLEADTRFAVFEFLFTCFP